MNSTLIQLSLKTIPLQFLPKCRHFRSSCVLDPCLWQRAGLNHFGMALYSFLGVSPGVEAASASLSHCQRISAMAQLRASPACFGSHMGIASSGVIWRCQLMVQ